MAEAGKYPVKWRDQTYYMHDCTVKDKEAFVAWAKTYFQLENAKSLGHFPHLLTPVLAAIPASVWWSDRGMSDLCADALKCPDGDRKFNRLLFGDSVKALSDADLDELMNEKFAEQNAANRKLIESGYTGENFPPVNDYFLALENIREFSDPKA